MVRGYLYMVVPTIYGTSPPCTSDPSGGVMLIKRVINNSLGIYLCITINNSWSLITLSGLLLQAVSTSVLLEVRSS